MQQSESVVYLELDSLIPNPYQPRKNFNDNTINELALSIKEYGILNPILVRKKEDKYEIIAGERRCRAAKIAGLNQIPAIIKDIDDAKLAEMALIENLQRENLSPVEEAASYKEILELANLTEQKLSEMIGKSQPSISNKMRLLNLPDEVKDALNNRKISERHARSLLTVNDKNKQIELLNEIVNKRLTVKELDNKIKSLNEGNNDDNILSSLNKKEEKESDNMNNANFFPNYNNANQNNNISLNTMNMQAMPEANNAIPQVPPVAALAQEPAAPAPNPLEQPMPFNMGETAPVANQPILEPVMQVEPSVTAEVESPIPNFGVNAPVDPTTSMPQNDNQVPVEAPTPMSNFNDIPLFSNQNINPEPPTGMETIPGTNNFVVDQQPVVENNPAPQVAPVLPAENTPTFEVPVEAPAPTMPEDKFTQAKNLLDSNGISYKAYSGETGNCIIIEL